MAVIEWDKTGERIYETGVEKGVLYGRSKDGKYTNGVAWNGLTNVNENPTGAEPTPLYADNIKYLNLMSAEEFEGTIEAYTYPDEFEAFDGSAEIAPGVLAGQQNRSTFGLAYRTILGNDVEYNDYGYKLHLVYGAKASPSSREYETVNDTPDAITFSWDFTTTPEPVPGFKATATLVFDSTKVSKAKMDQLEKILYGSTDSEPRLPLPAEVIEIMGEEGTEVTPEAPTFDDTDGVITIPDVEGVQYKLDGSNVSSGAQTPIEQGVDAIVTAESKTGYKLPSSATKSWTFQWNA